MIIDCHVHLLPAQVRKDRTRFCHRDAAFNALYCSEKSRLASEEDIIGYLDESAIDKAVVFGFPWEDHDIVRRNNAEVWDFHHRYPDRIIPFACLSCEGGDRAYREAERTIGKGFAGIGELAVYSYGWTRDHFQSLAPVVELARRAKVPVLVHVNEPVGHDYPGKIGVDFLALVDLIKSNPSVNFILAHFGGGIFVYGLMPEIGRVLARTYVDTAAQPFVYHARVYDIAVRIMGADKVLFGSDYPLLPLSRYVKEFEKEGLDGELRTRILGENAAELLGTGGLGNR